MIRKIAFDVTPQLGILVKSTLLDMINYIINSTPTSYAQTNTLQDLLSAFLF